MGLNPRKLKVFYGVIPLVAFASSWVTGSAFLPLYFLLTKKDVSLRRHPWELSEIPADWKKRIAAKAPKPRAKVRLEVE
ncbi:hypothetical protein BsWGS_28704 [Bradybaena similaris]